jgi:catechol 2,3-dioxygenase-like lactoylglutathione lyase family enzyme
MVRVEDFRIRSPCAPLLRLKMLRKIDCIMIRVENVEAAASYYADVFGLQPLWNGDGSVGLVFPETDAEIVFHCDPKIPSSVEVYYNQAGIDLRNRPGGQKIPVE